MGESQKKMITSNRVRSKLEPVEYDDTKIRGRGGPFRKHINTNDIQPQMIEGDKNAGIKFGEKRGSVTTNDIPLRGRKFNSPANPKDRGGRPFGAKDSKKRKTRDPVSTKRVP